MTQFVKFASPVRPHKQNLDKRMDTRLVFCTRNLMRTDIFTLGPPNRYAISWTL